MNSCNKSQLMIPSCIKESLMNWQSQIDGVDILLVYRNYVELSMDPFLESNYVNSVESSPELKNKKAEQI